MPMSLTCVLDRRARAGVAMAAAWIAVVLVSWQVRAQYSHEITGNKAVTVAGRGDTLWMVTTGGINFALTNGTSLSWWGYKTDSAYAKAAYGDGLALVGKFSERLGPSLLYLYDHAKASLTTLRYGRRILALDSVARDSALFFIYDLAWTPGCFWAACGDGGLMRLPSDSLRAGRTGGTAFCPGQDVGIASEQFPDSSALAANPHLLDHRFRVVGIDVVAETVWVAASKMVWRFTPGSSPAWDTLGAAISGTSKTLDEFIDVGVKHRDSSAAVFALASLSSETALLRYNSAVRKWEVFAEPVDDFKFGAADTIYAISGGVLHAYSQSRPGALLQPLTKQFGDRLTDADPNVTVPFINDVLYVTGTGDSSALWIATDNGLYYSRDERRDEAANRAFVREYRSLAVKSGLKQTYFYPTILTPDYPSGAFAYNLSKDAKVTITVYDWNMDLVKTVVRDAQRRAGAGRKDGRSEVQREDQWDGTNKSGKIVAPGVYYYKITASTGEHSFGKIIVAQ